MAFETGYISTISAKLSPSDTTISVATAPTAQSGRMHIYKGATHAWIAYTGVSGNMLTGVTFVSQTTDPATTVVGKTFPAGTAIELVEMHDQMLDKQNGGTIAGPVTFTDTVSTTKSFKVPVYANATARDAGIPSPTNGMIVYNTATGSHEQYISGAWTNFATGSVVNADTATAGKVEVSTQAEFDAGTDVGATGATIVPPPSVINTLNTIQYIAGEAIAKNDFLTYEEQTAFSNIAFSGLSSDITMGDATARTRQSIKVIGNGVSVSSIKLSLLKSGAPTDNVTIRIETDSGGLPSGTLANANATASIAGTGLTTSQVDTTITFSGAFTRTQGVPYHIVISRSGSVDGANYYKIGGITKNTRGFSQSIHNGTSWAVGANTVFAYVSDLGSYNILCVKTNASFADSVDFIGTSFYAYAIGAMVIIKQDPCINGFSGLSSTSNTLYFLSNTPGAISATAGTEYCPVGVNISSTTLRMELYPKMNRKKLITVTTTSGDVSSTGIKILNSLLTVTLSSPYGGSGTANYQTSPDNNTWTTIYSVSYTNISSGTTVTALSNGLFHRVNVVGGGSGVTYAAITY